MPKFAPTLDIYRPVLNVITDDFDRLAEAMKSKITANVGASAIKNVRFSKPDTVVIQPISPRELIGFHKEHELRFGRTEMRALRDYLLDEYPAGASTPPPVPTYPPLFYDIENKRAASTFVTLGADSIQTMQDRIELQRAIHALYELPETYEDISERWEDNEFFTRLIAATIRGTEPEPIVAESEALFAEQPEIFPQELELGQLRIDPSGVRP
jgi:hypothetical protein